jgi:hypothetical protein
MRKAPRDTSGQQKDSDNQRDTSGQQKDSDNQRETRISLART